MSIVKFGSILKFLGDEPTAEQKRDLLREIMVLTLSRATRADTNTSPVEIDTVRTLMKQEFGDEISAADIKVAASSELFETQPLRKYLSGVSSKLDQSDRVRIVNALASVIKADVRVSQMEIDFFNMVAKALNVSPAGLAGLIAPA